MEPKDATYLVARLQLALAEQEKEAQHSAEIQAQRMQEMAAKLQQAELQIRLLQDERDENIMSMGQAAQAEIHLEKELADLQRIKAELLQQREDICAARSFFAAQQIEELERARQLALQGGELGPEELASFLAALRDFSDTACELEGVLRSRAAYRHGAELRSKTAANATGGKADEHGNCEATDAALLHLLQVQQQVHQTQHLLEPEFNICSSAGMQGSRPSVAPLVLALHMRLQQSLMMRLMYHLAVEGEADAAKVLAREADVRELQDKLMEKQAQVAELSLEVSKLPEWEVKTATLLSEGAELRELLKATKAKYKERMLAVGGQNKILRQQMLHKHEAFQQLQTSNQAESLRGQALDAELKHAKEQANVVSKQVAALNEHCQQLQLSLTQQAKRADGLEYQLQEAKKISGVAGAQAQAEKQGLQDQVQLLEQETQVRDIQLAELHAEMQAQLLAVREAYSEELRALYDQVARAEAHAGSPRRSILPPSAHSPEPFSPRSPIYHGSPGGYLLLQQQLHEARQQSMALGEEVSRLKAKHQLDGHRYKQQLLYGTQQAQQQAELEAYKQQLAAYKAQQRLQQQQQQQGILEEEEVERQQRWCQQVQQTQQQQQPRTEQAWPPPPPQQQQIGEHHDQGAPSSSYAHQQQPFQQQQAAATGDAPAAHPHMQPHARQHQYQQQVQEAWDAKQRQAAEAQGLIAANLSGLTGRAPDDWAAGRLEALGHSVQGSLGDTVNLGSAPRVIPATSGDPLWPPLWEWEQAQGRESDQPSWQAVLSKQRHPGQRPVAYHPQPSAHADHPGSELVAQEVHKKREEGLRRYHGQEHEKLKQAYQDVRHQARQQQQGPPEASQQPEQEDHRIQPSPSPSTCPSQQPPSHASSSHESSSIPPSPPAPSSSASPWSQHEGAPSSQPLSHLSSLEQGEDDGQDEEQDEEEHGEGQGDDDDDDNDDDDYDGDDGLHAGPRTLSTAPASEHNQAQQLPNTTRPSSAMPGAPCHPAPAGLPPRPSTAHRPSQLPYWPGMAPSSLAGQLSAAQRGQGAQPQPRNAWGTSTRNTMQHEPHPLPRSPSLSCQPGTAEQGSSKGYAQQDSRRRLPPTQHGTSAAGAVDAEADPRPGTPEPAPCSASPSRPVSATAAQHLEQSSQAASRPGQQAVQDSQPAAFRSRSVSSSASSPGKQEQEAAAARASALSAGLSVGMQGHLAGAARAAVSPGKLSHAGAARAVAAAATVSGRGFVSQLQAQQQQTHSGEVQRSRSSRAQGRQQVDEGQQGGSSRGGSDQGLPVPAEVQQLVHQFSGLEGGVRPRSAAPSAMQATSTSALREAPVPQNVLQYLSQYTGHEGGVRPSSAAPSLMRPPSQPTRTEVPVPSPLLHLVNQYQAREVEGQPLGRPGTAPSSDRQHTRARATANTTAAPSQHPSLEACKATVPPSYQEAGVELREGTLIDLEESSEAASSVAPPHHQGFVLRTSSQGSR